MSSGTPINKGRATSAAARRAERTQARAQRQQVRAMEARAAKTGTTFVDTSGMDAEFVEAGNAAAASAMRRGRPVARPVMLTRAQEYAFIRADMRRLLITAAALLALMIVLLFIFD